MRASVLKAIINSALKTQNLEITRLEEGDWYEIEGRGLCYQAAVMTGQEIYLLFLDENEEPVLVPTTSTAS